MDEFEDFDTLYPGQVIRAFDPFVQREFPFILQPYSNPLRTPDDGDERNLNSLKENGLLVGGVLDFLFLSSMAIYFVFGMFDLFGGSPEYTFSKEPFNL